MISVIITTHNRLDYLKKAIASVLKQTYREFECIIVDDGSTDGTKQYLQSLSDARIRYIKRTKAFGCDTLPKNRGVKISKGDYIAFLDDDNQYLPDHLQCLINEIKRDDTLDLVYGDRLIIDEEKRFSNQIGIHSEFSPYLLLLRNYIDTSDVLIKRESLFEVGGWDERYTKYVDWNLFLRMAKAGMKFKRVPKIITEYYIHNKQKSATVKTKGDDEQKGLFVPEWNPFELEIDLPFLHTPKEIKVAIFSLTKDRLDYTKKCFASLKEKAGYHHDHFIVDQGSLDGTQDWIMNEYEYKHITMMKTNEGISRGSNIAIKDISSQLCEEKYDIIIKVDNDCLFLTDNWLKEIVELYKRNHLLCFAPYPEGLRDNPGGSPRIEYGQLNGHMLGITNHLGGLCHIAPASVYRNFRWNEHSPLHGFQDLELSQWLTKNGYQMAYIEDIRVEHFEGTEGQHKRYPEYFKLRELERKTIL